MVFTPAKNTSMHVNKQNTQPPTLKPTPTPTHPLSPTHNTRTGWQFTEGQVLGRVRDNEGALRVEEQVSERVQSNGEVRDVNTHGLLTHGRLVPVARGQWSVVSGQ
jgi:hypothetical protein